MLEDWATFTPSHPWHHYPSLPLFFNSRFIVYSTQEFVTIKKNNLRFFSGINSNVICKLTVWSIYLESALSLDFRLYVTVLFSFLSSSFSSSSCYESFCCWFQCNSSQREFLPNLQPSSHMCWLFKATGWILCR